jgi:hypothetical protein
MEIFLACRNTFRDRASRWNDAEIAGAGAIVGGLTAVWWSSLWWEVLGWHEKTMSGFQNEDERFRFQRNAAHPKGVP